MSTTTKPSKKPRHKVISTLAKFAAKRLGTNYQLGKFFGVSHGKYANLASGEGATRLENMGLKTLIEITHVNGIQLVPIAMSDEAENTPAKAKLVADIQDAFIKLYAELPAVPTDGKAA